MQLGIVNAQTTPERGEVAKTNQVQKGAGYSESSRPGEDNSRHVVFFIIALGAIAVATGHLNVKVGK